MDYIWKLLEAKSLNIIKTLMHFNTVKFYPLNYPHGPPLSKKIKTNFQPSMKLLPIPKYLLNHFTRRKKLCRNREPIQNSKERLKTRRTHKLTTFTSCEEIKLMDALFIWFSQINFKQKISPLTRRNEAQYQAETILLLEYSINGMFGKL